MGYYNPILRWGLASFASSARSCGVAGVIVTDLTPEESDEWVACCRASGVQTIFLAAPTSTDARLQAVCSRSTGFVYAVSRTGVTGAANVLPSEVRELVARIKRCTPLPVCVGFGIRTPQDVRAIAGVADGVVIGSWLVDWIDKNWNEGKGREALVGEIRKLKEATGI